MRLPASLEAATTELEKLESEMNQISKSMKDTRHRLRQARVERQDREADLLQQQMLEQYRNLDELFKREHRLRNNVLLAELSEDMGQVRTKIGSDPNAGESLVPYLRDLENGLSVLKDLHYAAARSH